MTGRCNCSIVNGFFFFIFCLQFFKVFTTYARVFFRLSRFAYCVFTDCTYIAVTCVPVAVIIFSVVLFVEVNEMMITFLLQSIFLQLAAGNLAHFDFINENSGPHEFIIIIDFTAVTHRFQLFVAVVGIAGIAAVIRVIVGFFEFIAVA